MISYFSFGLRVFILSILSIYVSVVSSSFFRWKQVISVSLTGNSSLHLLQVSNEGRNTAAKGPLCISLVRRVLWSTWSGLIMADFPSRYAMKRESLIGVWIVWNQERSGSSTLGKWILFKVLFDCIRFSLKFLVTYIWLRFTQTHFDKTP